ncbi:Extradiol aromatic ring-opening dioxygenase [Gonapodya prolifera JEL478]|uniref:Extradiol aromatic ring-opening dioxygenase n=1 Tax=Gonapodya prolifera (strain JEL478) TaxID=1344416 RepID=A0A138ZX88_GONPJ|nr:Extradiol aromatic ring-opening dioxygenase [Gonapodya prolifera JEL478]|eukprot:KXS09061.1 Extradiol aromatic ring-opening dioxygenase [Gonapodya prolifera JEL478]
MSKLNRAPSLFVPHGVLDQSSAISQFMKSAWPHLLMNKDSNPTPPKAILLVTAHWEEPEDHPTGNSGHDRGPAISAGSRHDLLFDYYGFPPETYKYKYPAPGSPEIAQKAFDLLKGAGFRPRLDTKRGWDHGVFVPMLLIRPEADIPIIQCSLLSTLNAEEHVRMGQALEPLRNEGVAIVGSGYSFHNMRLFRATGFGRGGKLPDDMTKKLREFGEGIKQACTVASPTDRVKQLKEWAKIPGGRIAHEREENLLPLLVCAGAAGNDAGKLVWEETDTPTPPVHSYLWE